MIDITILLIMISHEKKMLFSPGDCAVAPHQTESGERGRPHVVRRVSYIPLAWPNNRFTWINNEQR